jgi:hypothetical protein
VVSLTFGNLWSIVTDKFIDKSHKRPQIILRVRPYERPHLAPPNAIGENYGLSHHNLVLNLSGPITAVAAFTLVELTESSDVG